MESESNRELHRSPFEEGSDGILACISSSLLDLGSNSPHRLRSISIPAQHEKRSWLKHTSNFVLAHAQEGNQLPRMEGSLLKMRSNRRTANISGCQEAADPSGTPGTNQSESHMQRIAMKPNAYLKSGNTHQTVGGEWCVSSLHLRRTRPVTLIIIQDFGNESKRHYMQRIAI